MRRGRRIDDQHSHHGRHSVRRRLGNVGAGGSLRHKTRGSGWRKTRGCQRNRVFRGVRVGILRHNAPAVAQPARHSGRASAAVPTPHSRRHTLSGRARSVAQHTVGLHTHVDADNHPAGRAHSRRRRNRASRAPLRRPPARHPRQLDNPPRSSRGRLSNPSRRRCDHVELQPLHRLAAHVFSLRADVRPRGVRLALARGAPQAAPSVRRLRARRARTRHRRHPNDSAAPIPNRILQHSGEQKRHRRPLADGLLARRIQGSARNAAGNAANRSRRHLRPRVSPRGSRHAPHPGRRQAQTVHQPKFPIILRHLRRRPTPRRRRFLAARSLRRSRRLDSRRPRQIRIRLPRRLRRGARIPTDSNRRRLRHIRERKRPYIYKGSVRRIRHARNVPAVHIPIPPARPPQAPAPRRRDLRIFAIRLLALRRDARRRLPNLIPAARIPHPRHRNREVD